MADAAGQIARSSETVAAAAAEEGTAFIETSTALSALTGLADRAGASLQQAAGRSLS